MNIPDDLDMGKTGMDRKKIKKGITCELHNETDPGFPQECVVDCRKSGRENGAMECSNIMSHKGTYDDVILKK